MQFEWIKIDVEVENGDYWPPFFVGSMLRGVIGHALKKVVCINPSYKCEGCFAANECLFYRFYEKKNVFHAYRLGIRLEPKTLDFSFYLFEDGVQSLPYMLSAIRKAIEELGVGREHRRLKIARMSVGGKTVYEAGNFLSLEGIETKSFEIDTFYPDVKVAFTMPLRIKEGNRFARESVSLHTLIGNIHARYGQLKGEAPSRLGYRIVGEVTDSSLSFVEMQRYSNRQRRGMSMGGLLGEMTIKGLDKQSYAYLKIGEVIGAGKQTVFGLGSYRVIPRLKKEGV